MGGGTFGRGITVQMVCTKYIDKEKNMCTCTDIYDLDNSIHHVFKCIHIRTYTNRGVYRSDSFSLVVVIILNEASAASEIIIRDDDNGDMSLMITKRSIQSSIY